MLHGLRGEGEAVPALLGMVAMELQRAAALARVAARGGNLQAEFKAQRIWDSKQAAYTRALKRHDAARWERFAAEAGRVDRIAKGRPQWGRDPHDAWLALERVLLAVADPRALRLLG
jgi:DNA polymerase-3 subunit delta